jgi:choice-of-anchor B domain-containing protein
VAAADSCGAEAGGEVASEAYRQISQAVVGACSNADANELGRASLYDLALDGWRTCRLVGKAVPQPLVGREQASPPDSCGNLGRRVGAVLSRVAIRAWRRAFDLIAARQMQVDLKEILVVRAARRVERARSHLLRLLDERCGTSAFELTWGVDPEEFVASIGEASRCFSAEVYQQAAVTCAETSSAQSSSSACVGGSAGGYPCSGVDLEAYLPLSSIGGGSGNDIWGWTDSSTGREYALMGRSSGVSFVDVSLPASPIYLGNLPTHTVNSSWRDVKVYGDHAFVVSEAAGHGMQVFDLARLRGVPSPPHTFTSTNHYAAVGSAHNIVVNTDTGYAYIVGSTTCSGGLHFVDVRNPSAPVFAGCFSGDGYTHDAQCVVYAGPDAAHSGREICFNANEDTLTIVDVTNKAAPAILSRVSYAGQHYAHQVWTTPDQRYLLMNDELDEVNLGGPTRTYLWNISDLEAPTSLGYYAGASGSIDHNLYIRDGYAYAANYKGGLRILDLSGISGGRLSEIGYFDVYPPNDTTGFLGAWSVYPYFDSGTVVVSGIESGLFVLSPELLPAAAPNGAEFVTQSVPSVMSAGQQYAVSVTMRNTGTNTWAAGSYVLGSQNPHENANWGASRLSLPADVAPGGDAVVSWTVTAPAAAGQYNFQWRMLNIGVEWFGELSDNVAVTVQGASSPPNASLFVGQSVPAVMGVGQAYAVSVTMRNTGTNTWVAGSYVLGSQNPHENRDWGPSRVSLSGSVAPGQDAVVSWMVTAPAVVGQYNFQWRILNVAVEWFGELSDNVVVTVQQSAPPNASQYVTQSPPGVMSAGQPYAVSVTMRNTGTNTWTPGSYVLGSQNPHENRNWGPSRVSLSGSVAPGQDAVVSWTVTAPVVAGQYNFQWRLLNVGVEWFGEPSANVVVTVQAGPVNASAYLGQTVPTVMTVGSSHSVSIRLRNEGTTTWSAGRYQLGPQNPHDNRDWGGRVGLPSDVAPGQEVSLASTVTAPTAAGTYNFQWRMLELGVQWFGDRSSIARVDVVESRPTSANSLRFRGNGVGAPGLDRVKIRIDDPSTNEAGTPVDVGATDFTIEFWMKASASENSAGPVTCGSNINWINGNIVIDRDRFNQDRKFGLSLADGRFVFGVSGDATGELTICGSTDVRDDQWHHIAVQRRRSDGYMWLHVDGFLESEGDGPDGDVSYPDDGVPCGNCCGGSDCGESDPFVVIGAEKHDAGSSFPSYSGYMDDLRFSASLRYVGASFALPAEPFVTDSDTAALYGFEAGNADIITDSSNAAGGPSSGRRYYGGGPAGPDWSTDTPFPTTPAAVVELVAGGFSQPVTITHASDHRLFIVDRPGRIHIYDGAQVLAQPFLDIDPVVRSVDGEQGLLGLAFHPNYEENGYFFVNYTDNSGDTVIARYRRSVLAPDLADAASGVVLLNIEQPFSNHNGGQLQFGPDGYLYIGMGDGGSGGDPSCNAQGGETLLGKILRIDVDQNVGTPPYHGVPADNPFVGPGDPLDEIWAMGVRNPWRFSFDRATGALFVGDVGQDLIEEVSYQIPDSIGGENFGWKMMEGLSCFSTANCPTGIPVCDDPSLNMPILQYSHTSGNCSVTGGYVSRGEALPALFGSYLYADYCTGRIWAARQDDGAWTAQLLATTGNVATFGEDSGGKVYMGVNGAVYRLR